MIKSENLPLSVTQVLFFSIALFSTLSGWTQGLGLGTNTPTEILHLFRDQNVITGDVTIRHQTQATGTGDITSSPSSGVSSNLAGVGTIAWTNPTNADATDDTYTTAILGTSNYLYTDVGFAIPGGASISSVTAEVEKSYTNNPVALLDPWAGNSHTINSATYNFNYAISAGTGRALVVCVYNNNNDGFVETLNSVTWGGQNLINRGVVQNGNNENSTLEIWTLAEAGIAVAAGTSLAFTWSGVVDDAQFYYAGSYQYVDQTTPISASAINTSNDVTTLQLSTPLAVNTGDMVISTAGFGNDKRVLTEPAGYSVEVSQEFNSGPDGSFSVSTKSITDTGSEQPTTTYTVGVEDMSVGAIVLNNGFGNTTDNVVSLYSGGGLIGANLASGTPWTTADTYASYSGVASLSQINAADFGLVVSGTVTGTYCTAQIDHVRISVVYSTTPAVFTNFSTGLDLSTSNYVISQSSALGTSDIMRMNTGSITFSVAAGVFSDARYKTNIQPLSGVMHKLNKIKGVSYDMRISEFPNMSFSEDRQIGFIAQDLEKVYPELIRTDEQGYKSVTYATMTPILVEAIKELSKKIEQLEHRNDKLSAKVKSYEHLENEVKEIKSILLQIGVESKSDFTAKK